MLKKICTIMLFVAAIIFVGQDKTFAADYYIGTYPDGRDCYVMTESISKHRDADDLTVYECRVKAVYPNSSNIVYIDYEFWPDPMPHFVNSRNEGGNYLMRESDNPIEWKLFQYLIHRN